MAERPLSDLQLRVLRAMVRLEEEERRFARYAFSANEIGIAVGARTVRGGGSGSGRGSGHRVFGPAQQIIPPLNGLVKRGLIGTAARDDGMSGGAFRTTKAGREAALTCPDGGRCHHGCGAACWRVATCAPLSASGWDDWPEEIKAVHVGSTGTI